MTDEDGRRRLKVAVVGPSAAGKSTLVNALREAGYNARHVAQEHSYVKDMWQRFVQPDTLIYLDVSFAELQRRRPGEWGPQRHAQEVERLAHARQHCDLYIPTDGLAAQEVREQALAFLRHLPPSSETPA